jgi:hypothetical protein
LVAARLTESSARLGSRGWYCRGWYCRGWYCLNIRCNAKRYFWDIRGNVEARSRDRNRIPQEIRTWTTRANPALQSTRGRSRESS